MTAAPSDLAAIAPPGAPAKGPYSHAIQTPDLLFISGQLPIDPATGSLVSPDPVAQLQQCLRNLATLARAAGSDLSRTVKTTVLLRDLSRLAELNAAYAAFFTAPYPARTTFAVSALPMDAQVEIDATLYTGAPA